MRPPSMKALSVFVWNEVFGTGLGDIDDQHKRLVDLLNQVASQLAFGVDREALARVFRELVSYTEYHFRHEEALWAQHLGGEADERSHRERHAEFERKLEQLAATGSAGEIDPETLLDFLVRWLAGHILRADRYFALCVIGLREGLSLPQARARAADQVQKHEGLMELVLTVTSALSKNTLRLMQELHARSNEAQRLRQAASVFANANEAIMITDPQGTILDVNAAFEHITGFPRAEAVGHNARLLKVDEHEAAFYGDMWTALMLQGRWHGEVWGRRRNGELFAKLQTISAVRNDMGELAHYVCLFTDITAAKEHQKKLADATHFDALTHLPNRTLLTDRMHGLLAQLPHAGGTLAVACLDLDAFHEVNAQCGHTGGDRVLTQLASRLHSGLPETALLARLGGDEFALVVMCSGGRSDAVAALSAVREAVAQPLEVDGRRWQLSASMGAVLLQAADGSVAPDQLLRSAAQALFKAKQSGRNRLHVFDADRDRMVRGRLEQVELVRQALEAGQFELFYQPKVHMRSGAMLGVEALIRWRHPERGLVLPGEFLPGVEGHSVGLALDDWVLDAALQQQAQWRTQGVELTVSVNVSAAQLSRPDFLQVLQEALARHPTVRPGDLELEVLESSALKDMARVSCLIDACRALGVDFAIDDFGTGYSSLAYLKELGAQCLKVDQRFVRDVLEDPDDLSILDAVLGLARAFRRQVVAEGVETVAHGEMLLHLGYEFAQGYAIARPMPAQEIPAWKATWQPDAVWQACARLPHERLQLLRAVVKERAWCQALLQRLQGQGSEHPEPPLIPGLSDHPEKLWEAWGVEASVAEALDWTEACELGTLLRTCAQAWLREAELSGQPLQAEALQELVALRDRWIAALKALALG
ncbi:bacteriohemerythrin [Inhella gelatinilytica]|uniref:Bacteriohemerythrin n=1 Tax=Inhella gelatinilytica TaxID=2795030 RepID=A0A931IW82_9BURK|nr:bacteriohemerythrin [Inhella gelatinilytica]MBH9552150.1 bacteriohemerythrin [Inhella gelatinilytica]